MKVSHLPKSLTTLQFCGAIAAAIGCSLVATNANALTLNSTNGVWSNPIGGSNISYETIGDENQIRWGTPAGSRSADDENSGLGFTGVGVTPIVIESEFLLGTLRHFNNPVSLSTIVTSVDLVIALDLAGIGIKEFEFTFLIDETANSLNPCPYGDTQPCADAITWNNAFAPQNFSDGGINYTLELLGFGSGGSITQFISDEGTTNSAGLYARITQDSRNVPTPAAVLPVLTGMLSAAFRKKKREEEV